MAKKTLSDKQAKAVLRTKWKEVTGRDKGFPPAFDGAKWVRASPKPGGGHPSAKARLLKAGELIGRHPDGLYVVVGEVNGEVVADGVAIEVCGSMQNFESKRHTYSDRSLRVELSDAWLADPRTRNLQTKPIWTWIGFRSNPSTGAGSVIVPIRLISVLYVLPEPLYRNMRASIVPYTNEFFCKMSSLGSWDAQGYKRFLRGLTWDDRQERTYYTKS